MRTILKVVVLLAVPLALCLLAVRGAGWFANHAMPIITRITSVTLILAVVISVPACLFRRARAYAGASLVYWSLLAGLQVWLYSLLLVLQLWGVVWVVVGILLGGVGVIPLAFLAVLLSGQWGALGDMSISVGLIFSARLFGSFMGSRTGPESA